jgi:uncharacterized protein (TIRG00374 family)
MTFDKWKYAVVLLCTLFLIAILLSQIHVQNLVGVLSRLSWQWFLVGLLLCVCNYSLRSLRFQLLISSKPVSFMNLLPVSFVHGMYNQLLPLRTGEISYMIILKKTHNVSLSEGFSTLFVARVFDLCVISVILTILSILYLDDLPNDFLKYVVLISGMVIGFTVTLFFVKAIAWKIFRIVEKVFMLMRLEKSVFFGRLLRTMKEVTNVFHVIRSQRNGAKILALTVLIWCSTFLILYVVLLSIGYPLNLWKVVFVNVAVIMTTLLPVQGFANFGTLEASWTVVFLWLGYSKDVAIVTAFGSHVVLLAYVICLGVMGLLWLRQQR